MKPVLYLRRNMQTVYRLRPRDPDSVALQILMTYGLQTMGVRTLDSGELDEYILTGENELKKNTIGIKGRAEGEEYQQN